MPIHINLLAEQQSAEDQRRRDPVKRATWAAGCVVGLVVLWAGYLQFKLMAARGEINSVEAKYKAIEPAYKEVTNAVEKIAVIKRRSDALQNLSAGRLLWATPLNALQFSMVDGVQLVRLKTEQAFTSHDGTKATTNASGAFVPGKPATSREKTVLTIEARDISKAPGDQVVKFQEAVQNQPYFKTNLQRVEQTSRSAVQTDPMEPSKPFVAFTLEGRYPEKER